jgi:hypothetical protein
MSQVRKSRVQLYRSKNRCLETLIYSETMSRERFLHFTDDEAEVDENDKLKKSNSLHGAESFLRS